MPNDKPKEKTTFERSTERHVVRLLREAKEFEDRAKAVGLAIKWASVKHRIPPGDYGGGFTETEEDEDGA